MNIPKVRIQVMFSQADIQLMQQIDEEYGGKNNPSRIVSIIFENYKKWFKIAKLYEKELRSNEEKMKNIEYELRHKIKQNEVLKDDKETLLV